MDDRKHDIQLIATEHQFINLWITKALSGPHVVLNSTSLVSDESSVRYTFHLIIVLDCLEAGGLKPKKKIVNNLNIV